MAQLIPFIPAIISGGSMLVGGLQKKSAAEEQALEFERRAGESRATSQREGIEERRQARLSSSKALAAAAAGGGGASDPDVVSRIADIEGEGEYNFLKALYEGSTASDQDLRQAAVTKKAGQRQLISSVIGGASDIATTTMLQKYG